MVGRPRSYLGYGMLSAMRWLGLVVLASCTLITDPSSFESSDAGPTSDTRVDAGDAQVDAPVDAPRPDVPGVDTSTPLPCCGTDCTSPFEDVVLTRIDNWWSESSMGPLPDPDPMSRFRSVQLIPRGSVEVVSLTRRGLAGYEVLEVTPTGPPSPTPTGLRPWLADMLETTCLNPSPIIDVDVQVTPSGELTAVVVQESLTTDDTTSMHRLAGSCETSVATEALPGGWASVAPMRGITALDVAGDRTTLLIGDTEFPYDEILGVAARGELLAVLNQPAGAGELNVEYWTGGERQPGLRTGAFTAAPDIAAVDAADWLVTHAVADELVVHRVRADPFAVDTIPASLSVGRHVAVAMLDPVNEYAVVVATHADDRNAFAVYILRYRDGSLNRVFESSVDRPIVGLDVIVEHDSGPPRITWAVHTGESHVWQTTRCPMP